MDGSSNSYRRVSRKWSNISQTLTTTGTTNGTVVYTITQQLMDVLETLLLEQSPLHPSAPTAAITQPTCSTRLEL
jgi:hypothetical protein